MQELDYFSQTRPEMMSRVPTQARRILEFGCGEGRFGEQIKARQNQLNQPVVYWGIEPNAQAHAQAVQRLDRCILSTAEAAQNSLAKDSQKELFDCLVFNDVLEHLVDPGQVLKQSQSLLGPNGCIVASLPNVRYFFNLVELVIQKKWTYRDAGILDRTHLRFFTQSSIVDLFQECGYEIQSICGINSIQSWKWNLVNFLTCGWISDTAHLQFAVVARKSKLK